MTRVVICMKTWCVIYDFLILVGGKSRVSVSCMGTLLVIGCVTFLLLLMVLQIEWCGTMRQMVATLLKQIIRANIKETWVWSSSLLLEINLEVAVPS